MFSDLTDVEDSLMRKPVHYASAFHDSFNLEALISSGASLKEYDRKKVTPLMIACMEGLSHNVYRILEKVRDPFYINSRSD